MVGAVSAPDVSHVVLAVRGSQASWEYKSEIKTAWMLSPQDCCPRCSRGSMGQDGVDTGS